MRYRFVPTLIAMMSVSLVAALSATAPAAAAPVAPAAPAAVSGAAAAPVPGGALVPAVPVTSLRAVGARTSVVVRKVKNRAQARWIDHVVDRSITSTEGCLADPSDSTLRRGAYRATVYTLCAGGPRTARSAAARLVASRPWYQVSVRPVAVVAFTLLADLERGNDRAVDAALAHLPRREFTYVEGDDVSLTYVGQSVTQAQLNAARAAFARALHVPVTRVTVLPIRW